MRTAPCFYYAHMGNGAPYDKKPPVRREAARRRPYFLHS